MEYILYILIWGFVISTFLNFFGKKGGGSTSRPYDSAYDLDGDGQLDPFEMDRMNESMDSSGDSLRDDYLEQELDLAGLDRYDLEDMSEEERRNSLEDAGLDPDDFDGEF